LHFASVRDAGEEDDLKKKHLLDLLTKAKILKKQLQKSSTQKLIKSTGRLLKIILMLSADKLIMVTISITYYLYALIFATATFKSGSKPVFI